MPKSLKNNEFKFKRKGRKYIEKPRLYKPGEPKKIPPSGIPDFNDWLIQEAIRIILKVIYEPLFEFINCNYEFKPNKVCHHSIQYIQENDPGMNIALEGDIKNA